LRESVEQSEGSNSVTAKSSYHLRFDFCDVISQAQI